MMFSNRIFTSNVRTVARSFSSYVVAIDQGTTSSRALLIDREMKVVDVAQRSFNQISDHPGWVSHDPNAIYESVTTCLEEIAARNNLSKDNVVSVGITNQRETTVAYDRNSGQPLDNAIVWLDQRTSGVVHKIKDTKMGGDVDLYREHCGLPINTYFSATKMRWLLENSEKVRDASVSDK